MSDTSEKGQAEGTSPADSLANYKHEVDRKIGNVSTQVAELTKSNQQLLAQLQSMTVAKPAQTSSDDDLEDLWYKDPKAAAAKIEERAMNKIEAKINSTQAAQQKQTAVLNQLVREFPELSDDNNSLTKRAVEIYMSLDDDERRSPAAYKLAVKDAALELGVKPVSKRTGEDFDSYSVGSSGSNYDARQRGQKRDEIDPKTIAFAKALGRPVDDPKYLESLKQATKRTNWTKYE